MASLQISKKECFEKYVKFVKDHPERKKNQRVSLEDLEEVLNDHIIFTKLYIEYRVDQSPNSKTNIQQFRMKYYCAI